jgi:hypothetical protein
MYKRFVLLFSVVYVFSCVSARATELVANGSFETGTFAGWTSNVVGAPFIPWLVTPAGNGAGFGMQPTQPQAGQYDAWNGFDGAGPMMFTLSQDISIPPCTGSSATLTWSDRVQWNFALTSSATQARTYSVQVRDMAGTVLATLSSFSTGTALVIGDTGWQTHTADVSAYAGSTIRLWFEEDIPEFFTGPAQLEIDAVSVAVADFVSIDNCCTTIPNRVIDSATGTTLQQFVTSLADQCTADARNHGDFVQCVTRGLNGLEHGVISGQEKGAITSCAARSGRRGNYR